MKNRIINLLKILFDSNAGQQFLKKVHLLVLYLQNYGLSGECDTSGEINVIKKVGAILSKKENTIVFDVGANIGKYINFLDQNIKSKYTAFCFEPSKVTFKELINNTKNTKNIIPINKGLGDETTSITLYSNEISNTQSSLLKRDMSHWSESYNLKNEEEVSITTLDEFCQNENIDYIDFMKIDVEGFEMKTFNGAKKYIFEKRIGIIQFELGVASVDGKYFFKDVFYFLHENYHIYRITRSKLFEIKEYNELNEVFLTTNYLAILK